MNSKQLVRRVKPIKRIKKSSSVGELVIHLPHSLYVSKNEKNSDIISLKKSIEKHFKLNIHFNRLKIFLLYF